MFSNVFYMFAFSLICAFWLPFLSSCDSLLDPFGPLGPPFGPLGPPFGPPGSPSWVSEGLLGRPSAPLWASIGRPDPPLRPFGRAIASMDAAWTSQSIILDRCWLKFEPMFDYFWSNFAYFWRSMWPCFPIFVNELFSSSLLRSHLPGRRLDLPEHHVGSILDQM